MDIPKIDSYTHYAAPELMEYLKQETGEAPFEPLFDKIPILSCKDPSHVQSRLDFMQQQGVVCQILIPLPWIEACPAVWSNANKAARACRLANEAMSRFCNSNRQFLGVALIPTVNETILMEEYRYATQELGLVGTVLFVGPAATPPDDKCFESLYRESEQNQTPIWLHPCRPQSYADYDCYKDSKHAIWNSLGWIYDTSVAMVHMALSGVLQRYPSLKIVGHHGGGMIPFFIERFSVQSSNFDGDDTARYNDLKKFYVDTATFGYQPLNIRQCLDFFDEGRVLFGTDTPMDMSSPNSFCETACRSIRDLNLSSRKEEEDVFFRNALKFLGPRGAKVLQDVIVAQEDTSNIKAPTIPSMNVSCTVLKTRLVSRL